MLNESRGNMYAFVTHTWNTIKGRCPHDCSYCYMKRWGKQKDLHFDEKELKTDLGTGNFIFVGSSCDMWAENIDPYWIEKTIRKCLACDDKNRFLFQSKNPKGFNRWIIQWYLPRETYLGTTIETNRVYPQMGNTPSPHERSKEMREVWLSSKLTMVTIEPIMDFDLGILRNLVFDIRPSWVNIGADSGTHKLPEPPAGKVRELIAELSKFTEVKIKKNLNRILRGE